MATKAKTAEKKKAVPKRAAAKKKTESLKDFPYYEKGKVPQYHRYHAEVDFLDEIELIWGKRSTATPRTWS